MCSQLNKILPIYWVTVKSINPLGGGYAHANPGMEQRGSTAFVATGYPNDGD